MNRRATADLIETRFQLTMTQLQQSALMGIMVSHMLRPDSTIEWLMVTTGETVTLEDLIALVSQAKPVADLQVD